MDGKVWLEMAQILGVSQAAIAKHLGINRVMPHYWAHGIRPVSERFQQPLKDLVMMAAQNLADWPILLPSDPESSLEERREAEETRLAVIARVRTRLKELEIRLARQQAQTAVLDLNKLTPEGWDLVENAAFLVSCGTDIVDYGKTLQEYSQLLDIFRKKAVKLIRLTNEEAPDADLIRESTEPGDVCQPSAIDQQADAASLADSKH